MHKDDFAYVPDKGPPRLIRYEPLEKGTIATLDDEKNILRVDPEKFKLLSEVDKHNLLKTKSKLCLV